MDFPWIFFIGMNRMGFSYREMGHLYFGKWADIFEVYKKQHNFETRKGMYNLDEEEPVSSLDVL